MREFDLVEYLRARQKTYHSDVILGIGDDAAVTTVPEGYDLVTTVDTSVAGVHFSHDAPVESIGHKSLAVSLSDCAAMGAQPLWATLALTAPRLERSWIDAFSEGFFNLMNRHAVSLIGGDTTQGPLSITVHVFGIVRRAQMLKRSGARLGDDIYVTGTLGNAGLALHAKSCGIALTPEVENYVSQSLLFPEPRVAIGKLLRSYAHSAIDISDGFTADIGHILDASGFGGTIFLEQLPLSWALKSSLSFGQRYSLALTAGDDYELGFTASPEHRPAINAAIPSACCVGIVEAKPGLRLLHHQRPVMLEMSGYQHFVL